MKLFGEICCVYTLSLDAFDPNLGYVVGNASRTCSAIPPAGLKSDEMLCAIESVESNWFPLTSNNSNFFEISYLADYLHEVSTLLTSVFFGISRIELLLLKLWHHVLFSLDNWCFFLVRARTVWPFCVTCFVVFFCVLRALPLHRA